MNIQTALEWLTGFAWKEAPGRATRCHFFEACGNRILEGQETLRYVTGFFRGHARMAFVCPECARRLLLGLRNHVEGLRGRRPATAEEILAAQDLYETAHGDAGIQIDDDALVSEADGGFWVQGWVWVSEESQEG